MHTLREVDQAAAVETFRCGKSAQISKGTRTYIIPAACQSSLPVAHQAVSFTACPFAGCCALEPPRA